MIFPARRWLRAFALLAGAVLLLAVGELYRRETAFSAAEDGLRLQWEGEAQRALERFQTAELLSRHAFWDSDLHAAALYGVGISYADLKRYDEAESTLRDAIPRLEAVLGGANPRLAVAYQRLDAVIREKKGAAR
jgi:tetratricopeptide (TPR) repeat protein